MKAPVFAVAVLTVYLTLASCGQPDGVPGTNASAGGPGMGGQNGTAGNPGSGPGPLDGRGPGSGQGPQNGTLPGPGGPGGPGQGRDPGLGGQNETADNPAGDGGHGGPNGMGGRANNNNGTAGGQGGWKGPRGDDPRPRVWGQPNERNETEFDDRMSPRRLGFLGRSANFRIYPNYSDTSAYLQLRFSGVIELDDAGRPVPRHGIPSLANVDTAAFNAANITLSGVNGSSVNASSVNITLDPRTRPGFDPSPFCPAPGGGNQSSSSPSPSPSPAVNNRRALTGISSSPMPPMPPAPQGAYAPVVSVALLFGVQDAVTLPYGPDTISLPRNGLKWTFSFANWPFCNDSNSLSASLDLLLPSNSSAQISQSASGDTKTLSLVLGTAYNASLTFLSYAMDSANGSIRMPANISITQNGAVVTVTTVLPNPKRYNATSVYYDPTTTTTSAYLAPSDPANTATATVTATTESGSGSGGGSAGAVRAGLATALLAALVAALLLV